MARAAAVARPPETGSQLRRAVRSSCKKMTRQHHHISSASSASFPWHSSLSVDDDDDDDDGHDGTDAGDDDADRVADGSWVFFAYSLLLLVLGCVALCMQRNKRKGRLEMGWPWFAMSLTRRIRSATAGHKYGALADHAVGHRARTNQTRTNQIKQNPAQRV